mmetsp:Transcript_58210/g.168988  ORF Transcript_58210/g.168988 Transcript_58210/m.168988 type:complete len:88 (-) Transcript_58210:328-591(-)
MPRAARIVCAQGFRAEGAAPAAVSTAAFALGANDTGNGYEVHVVDGGDAMDQSGIGGASGCRFTDKGSQGSSSRNAPPDLRPENVSR